MADVPTPFPIAEPSKNRAARQLAAMRLLFDADRERHESDILLATVFETLSGGLTRSTDELLRQVEADWPGIVISRERLETTLEVAEERGLLTTIKGLGRTISWSITGMAEVGVGDSQEWARDVLDRCRGQIEERAREQEVEISREQADHWTGLLLEVLHEGMVESFTERPGDIREVARRLFPPYDRTKIVDGARSRFYDQGHADFMAALALSALDPGSVFGSEVVHYLGTGYVLYALLLGFDVTVWRQQLADFEGEVLLLDTPVLLRLLNGGKEFRWTSDLVGRIASMAGAVVAVTVRTRRELLEMLNRRDGDARRIERELADGVPRASLAAVVPDEVLAIWLTEPTEPNWNIFKKSSVTLMSTLKAMGIHIDFEPNGYEQDAGRCRQFAGIVREVTEQRGKRRHEVPAEHDGELLGVVAYLRRVAEKERGPDTMWPGAFIVTSDKSLTDAYQRLEDDDIPVALTLSQIASLLSRLAQPDDAEKLAELIATDIQWQSRFQRATAFGVDQAIELARSFCEHNPEAVLVEASAAELTFESILASADYKGDPTEAARAAIVHQQLRRREASGSQRSAGEAERLRDRERAARAEAAVRTLHQVNQRFVQESQDQVLKKQADNESLVTENKRLGRLLVVVSLYFVAICGLLVLVAADILEWRHLIAPGLTMAATAKWLYDWARDPAERIWSVILSAVAWVSLACLGVRLFP